MSALSIQSQVIYGHVGNSAAVAALQRLGCEVWPVPTTLLSHHPGHGAPGGRVLPAAEVAGLLAGVERLGALADCRAVLTGYLGSAETGRVALATLATMRRSRRDVLYVCDPVLGDVTPGLYVEAALPAFFRAEAVPQADILTPNRFELECLSGRRIASPADAVAAGRLLLARGPRGLVCTSVELAGGDHLGTLAVTADRAWLVTTPRLVKVPQGSGDLLAALLLGHLLNGLALADATALAVSATFAVLRLSQGAPELRLVANLDMLRAPEEVFPPTPWP